MRDLTANPLKQHEIVSLLFDFVSVAFKKGVEAGAAGNRIGESNFVATVCPTKESSLAINPAIQLFFYTPEEEERIRKELQAGAVNK